MQARMWTRGWDVWAPAAPIVFHQWERSCRAHSFQADRAAAAPQPPSAPASSKGPAAAAAISTADRAVGATGVLEHSASEGSAAWAAWREQRATSEARVLQVLGVQGGSSSLAAHAVPTPSTVPRDGCVSQHADTAGLPATSAHGAVPHEHRHSAAGSAWMLGGVWGLGTVRSLAALEAHLGVSFATRQMETWAHTGGLPTDACQV